MNLIESEVTVGEEPRASIEQTVTDVCVRDATVYFTYLDGSKDELCPLHKSLDIDVGSWSLSETAENRLTELQSTMAYCLHQPDNGKYDRLWTLERRYNGDDLIELVIPLDCSVLDDVTVCTVQEDEGVTEVVDNASFDNYELESMELYTTSLDGDVILDRRVREATFTEKFTERFELPMTATIDASGVDFGLLMLLMFLLVPLAPCRSETRDESYDVLVLFCLYYALIMSPLLVLLAGLFAVVFLVDSLVMLLFSAWYGLRERGVESQYNTVLDTTESDLSDLISAKMSIDVECSLTCET